MSDDAIPSEHVRWHGGRWQQLYWVAVKKWQPRRAEWRNMPDFVYEAIASDRWPKAKLTS